MPFRVRDVFGKIYALPAGDVPLGPKLWVTVNGAPTELAGPIVFLPGSSPLVLDRPYRGQIEVGVTGQKLNAVNVVGLEQYLQGVVAQEMPSAWPDEALKAQAVAARSYALSHRVSGKGFDLYADVRSQVYGGVGGEHPRTTAAVQRTKGEVLLWEGKPIDALFHSTSGGKTLAAVEVFGKAVPYLVAADDPHSALSPVHRWGPTPVAEATIRKGLKLRSPVTALKLTRGPSGRVTTVQAVTASGTTKISGATLRFAAGLRSTWITALGSLSLSRPGGPAVYGKVLTVTGKAAGIKGAVLSQRIDGVWQPLPGLSAKVKLLAPSSFRIAAGKVVRSGAEGPRRAARSSRRRRPKLVRNRQAASRRARRSSSSNSRTPAGRPFSRRPPTRRAASPRTSSEPGVYRARTAPGEGFAEGLSAQLEVP